MPNITSLGVGSGLDAEGIISSLMAVERRPLTLVQNEVTSFKTKLSSIGQLQSLTATMRDKANALTSLSLWGKMALTSADPSAVTGSSASGSPAGRYAVAVSALAASQTITSGTFTNSSTTLNAGTLTIELGTWVRDPDNPSAPPSRFDPKAGKTPVTITIGDGETSLASIRDKINAAGAGVTASIVNDANGARLSLRSTATGAENGFRLSATETTDDNNAATGLTALAFDAMAVSSPMSLNQWSANAKATINGISVESTSNTFADVADGLSLTVGKVTTTPVEVVVADDTAAVKTAITDFATAYNALANYMREQTKYDATTKVGGALQGDRTVIGFQSQLRGIINQPSTASSTWSALSDIGLSLKEDGTLETNTSKLTEALTKPAELRKLLATDGSDSGSSGFMDRYRDLGNQVLGADGSLETSEQSINQRITRDTDRQAEMETRLARTEARLRAQYQALDASMASLSALSSYVTQQLSSLRTTA